MMNFSDLLNIFELLLTFIVGFYLAHWYSVRDSQSRSIKDYYINRLDEFKKEIDSFFQKVLKGECSSKQVTEWYEVLENRLLAFDNGLCMALPIRKRGLTDIVFNAHSNLSLLDEFNEQFNYDSIHFGTESRQKIKSHKRGLDENINQYITLINHSSYNNLFVKLWYNIKNDWIYYREVKNICFPIIQILWNLARVYCLQILCITFIVVGVNRVIKEYNIAQQMEEVKMKEDAESEMMMYQSLRKIELNVNEMKGMMVGSNQ